MRPRTDAEACGGLDGFIARCLGDEPRFDAARLVLSLPGQDELTWE